MKEFSNGKWPSDPGLNPPFVFSESDKEERREEQRTTPQRDSSIGNPY